MKINHQRMVEGRVSSRNNQDFTRRTGKPKPKPKQLDRFFREAMSLI